MMRAAFAALAILPTQALADFTENNLLTIFYHEVGHAIIDQMQVPIFGQEEDAADTLSIFLIDALYESDDAEAIAYDSANLFWVESEAEPAFWDTHGPDEQRYFNTVCLFYGADPEAREEFADDFDLPDERAEGCEGEYALAADSWNAVLDDMSEVAGGKGKLVFKGASQMAALNEGIEALNAEFNWPRDMPVYLERCGEANAYYDYETQSITMCSELSGWLEEIATQLYAD